ncbi:MAG: hypothetical protein H6680_06535 [Desulfobacteraceae bacterium]|nr:hypothetical protein [Desulfobacteraceae bacterium]
MEKSFLELVTAQKTMNICVIENNLPWCAPVYFVFDEKFYFFSSPESIHILYGLDKKVSCTVFCDGFETKKIRGLQMRGEILKPGFKEASKAFLKYIKKFSSLVKNSGKDFSGFKDKFKSEFFCFEPEYIVYTDNSKGFGNKTIIKAK